MVSLPPSPFNKMCLTRRGGLENSVQEDKQQVYAGPARPVAAALLVMGHRTLTPLHVQGKWVRAPNTQCILEEEGSTTKVGTKVQLVI